MVLIITGLIVLVSGIYAFTFPKAYRHLEESSRFKIGYERGAGLLNKYVRRAYPILNFGTKFIFIVSVVFFIYLLIIMFGVI